MELSDMYGSIAGTTVDHANLERLKSDIAKKGKGTEDEQLMDACKQFESYFVEQMFKEMWKTIPESDYSMQSTSNMVDYYKDEMIKEFAELNTEQGGLGFAQMLYESMKRNYEI